MKKIETSNAPAAADPALLQRLDAVERTVRELKQRPSAPRSAMPDDAPPLPEDDDPPAAPEFRPRDDRSPHVAETPAPLAPPVPAGGLSPEDWQTILGPLREKLGAPYSLMLGRLPLPVLEGNMLTLSPEGFARQQLAKPEVLNAVAEEAGALLGRKLTVRLGDPEAEEKMRRLEEKFSRFDNFTVV